MRKQSTHIMYTSKLINNEYTIHNTVFDSIFQFIFKILTSSVSLFCFPPVYELRGNQEAPWMHAIPFTPLSHLITFSDS